MSSSRDFVFTLLTIGAAQQLGVENTGITFDKHGVDEVNLTASVLKELLLEVQALRREVDVLKGASSPPQCPAGWSPNNGLRPTRCFFLDVVPRDHANATAFCSTLAPGSRLAIISSNEDLAAALVANGAHISTRTSGICNKTDTAWYSKWKCGWGDDTSVDWELFTDGEPDTTSANTMVGINTLGLFDGKERSRLSLCSLDLAPGGGRVLQVVSRSFVLPHPVSGTNTDYLDTPEYIVDNYQTSIQPLSPTSRILARYTIWLAGERHGPSDAYSALAFAASNTSNPALGARDYAQVSGDIYSYRSNLGVGDWNNLDNKYQSNNGAAEYMHTHGVAPGQFAVYSILCRTRYAPSAQNPSYVMAELAGIGSSAQLTFTMTLTEVS